MDSGTRLWLPPLALAGCLRAAMLRDTRGRGLSGAELDNYFPATPLVMLLFLFDGSGQWQATPGFSRPASDQVQHPLMFGGPFTQPTHTRADGPTRALWLLFLPDAFRALTGVDPGAYLNRVVDARELLPGAWRDWAEALRDTPDDAGRLGRVEQFLLPRWQGLAPARPAGQRYADWTEALALRAATSAAGRSLRQVERRVKAWAGLPMRELRAVSRAENAFLAVAANEDRPDFNWADIAAGTDYADQSHLCRETRRLTGFSPDELRRRIREEEAFWAYRLWR